MDQSFRTSRSLFLAGFLIVLLALTSCTSTSRLHGQFVPEDSLRVGEVIYILTHKISQNDDIYQTLLSTGLSDSEIKDGTLAVARVFCCGGPNEGHTAIWFFAPAEIAVEINDIVEIWSGKEVKEGESRKGSKPNTATRVREKRTSSRKQCRWVPENEWLWARVIYCDWMEEEGWVQQTGLFHVWIKVL